MFNPANHGDMSGATVPDISALWDGTASSISTQGGASSYSPYAAGISAISSVISDQMATKAFKAKLEAETNAAIQNVGNAVTSFELEQIKNAENIANINHVLGDKLSERGLTAMKEAALLRTAAAETGTSGGTTDFAIKEAFINEHMDKANIVASARQQKRAIFSAMDMEQVGIKNQIDSVLLGGGVSIGTDPFLSALSGGLSTATQAFGMLPMSERAEAFGIKPKGSN